MNIALFGCTAKSAFLLESLLRITPVSYLITITEELAEKNGVADYNDLSKLASDNGVEVLYARTYGLHDARDIAAIAALSLDLALVAGWQRLIPAPVLKSIGIGVFGMHGSAMGLPRGRGRSPLNWSIIENRSQFATSLFRYDPDVDSGDIVDTLVFSIRPSDTAETLHFKNILAMKALVLSNIEHLLAGRKSLTPQPSISPTYYPKRKATDSLIDWTCDIHDIERFVRAVSRPFPAAYCFVEGVTVRILRAAVFEEDLVDFGYRNALPGKIVEVMPGGKPLVKCNGGLLMVHEYESETTLSKGSQLAAGDERINYFPRSKFGTFDCPGL